MGTREVATQLNRRAAAIDCGTNSTRLLIADGDGNTVREEVRLTRLGEGVHASRTLLASAIERSVAALVEYRSMLDEHDAGFVRAVATSAARDATNTGEFIAAARAASGFDIEVITGNEEAALGFAGATTERRSDEGFLVVDIGGGSTEIVLGAGGVIDFARSFDIGCVRLTEMFLRSDPPTPAQLDELSCFVDGQLGSSGLVEMVDKAAPTLLAVDGTASTLAMLDIGAETFDSRTVEGHVLSSARLVELHRELAGKSVANRTTTAVPLGRSEVIVAGTAVLSAVVAALGFDRVTVSTRDIMHGIIRGILDADDRYRR